MKSCIFCKIAKKEVPSNIVYEDKKVIAFLDVNPINKGHTLIIPKKHFKNIYEIPDVDLKSIILITKKLAKSMEKSLKE